MRERFARDTDEIVPAAIRVSSTDARAIIVAFLAEQRPTVAAALLPMYPRGTDGYARTVIAALVAAAKAWEVRG